MSSSSLFSPSFLLTAAFACALALQLLAQVGLLTRQVRHVARHRSALVRRARSPQCKRWLEVSTSVAGTSTHRMTVLIADTP